MGRYLKRNAPPSLVAQANAPDHPRQEAQALAALCRKGIETPDGVRRLIVLTMRDEKKLRAGKDGDFLADNTVKYRALVLFEFERALAAGIAR
jgi:hypothetical protein